MSKKDIERIEVHVGIPALTFTTGDLLNAINEVVCYFENQRELTPEQIVGALELYAKYVKENNGGIK